MHDVFISHCSENKQIADGIAHWLEDAGIRCWISPRDLYAGMNYSASIIKAIQECRVLVLVLTDAANCSAPVAGEVEQAVRCGVPIIPLRVEDIEPSPGIMLHIGSVHWLDALTPPLEAHYDKLTRSVSRFIEAFDSSDSKQDLTRSEKQPHPAPISNTTDARVWSSIHWMSAMVIGTVSAGLLLFLLFRFMTGGGLNASPDEVAETNPAAPFSSGRKTLPTISPEITPPTAPLAHIQIAISLSSETWIVRGFTLNEKERDAVLSRVRQVAPVELEDELVVAPDRVRNIVLEHLAAQDIDSVRILVRRRPNWGAAYLDIRTPESARTRVEQTLNQHILDTGDFKISVLP